MFIHVINVYYHKNQTIVYYIPVPTFLFFTSVFCFVCIAFFLFQERGGIQPNYPSLGPPMVPCVMAHTIGLITNTHEFWALNLLYRPVGIRVEL